MENGTYLNIRFSQTFAYNEANGCVKDRVPLVKLGVRVAVRRRSGNTSPCHLNSAGSVLFLAPADSTYHSRHGPPHLVQKGAHLSSLDVCKFEPDFVCRRSPKTLARFWRHLH